MDGCSAELKALSSADSGITGCRALLGAEHRPYGSARAPACSVNVPLCPNAPSGNVDPVAVSTTLPRPGGAGHRGERGRWRPGALRAARRAAMTR